MRIFASIGSAVLIALISLRPAIASLVTYEIAGSVTSANWLGSAPNPFQVGTPFTATLSFNTTQAPIMSGGNEASYEFAAPFALNIAGQSLESLGLVRDGGNGTFVVVAGPATGTKSIINIYLGWLDQFGNTLFGGSGFQIFPPLASPALSQLPVLTLAELNGPGVGLVAAGGQTVYLNGDPNEGFQSVTFTATSLTLIPEPSTLALAALGFLALAAWRLRRR